MAFSRGRGSSSARHLARRWRRRSTGRWRSRCHRRSFACTSSCRSTNSHRHPASRGPPAGAAPKDTRAHRSRRPGGSRSARSSAPIHNRPRARARDLRGTSRHTCTSSPRRRRKPRLAAADRSTRVCTGLRRDARRREPLPHRHPTSSTSMRPIRRSRRRRSPRRMHRRSALDSCSERSTPHRERQVSRSVIQPATQPPTAWVRSDVRRFAKPLGSSSGLPSATRACS